MPLFNKEALELFSTDLAAFNRIYVKGVGYPEESEEETLKRNFKSLLSTYILEPDTAQDKFIVAVKGPENVELDKYLKYLAVYINNSLNGPGGDEGIDIEALKQQAYDATMATISYNSMLEKASECEAYLSYLLMSNERELVDPNEIDVAKKYANFFLRDSQFGFHYKMYSPNITLASTTESSSHPNFTKVEIKYEMGSLGKPVSKYKFSMLDDALHGKHYYISNLQGKLGHVNAPGHLFLSTTDFVVINEALKQANFINFEITDSIINFHKNFDVTKYDIGIALTAEYIKFSKFFEGYEVNQYHAVADDMGRCYNFKIGDRTVEKAVQKLSKIVNKYSWHRKNKNWNLPYEFATKSVTL